MVNVLDFGFLIEVYVERSASWPEGVLLKWWFTPGNIYSNFDPIHFNVNSMSIAKIKELLCKLETITCESELIKVLILRSISIRILINSRLSISLSYKLHNSKFVLSLIFLNSIEMEIGNLNFNQELSSKLRVSRSQRTVKINGQFTWCTHFYLIFKFSFCFLAHLSSEWSFMVSLITSVRHSSIIPLQYNTFIILKDFIRSFRKKTTQ